MRKRRLSTALALAATCAATFGAASASAQAPAVTRCDTTFEVLHDDRIGTLTLPVGQYRIQTSELTCAKASALFTEFLQDYTGVLPRPWSYSVQGAGQGTFRRGTRQYFTVVSEGGGGGTGGGGSGGGGGTHGSLTCPSYFTVLNNDRIGALRLRAGRYRITLTTPRLSCSQASKYFAQFLQDYDGDLGGAWVLVTRTATFLNGSTGLGFRVKPWSGSGGGGGPTYPVNETQCPGTFAVQNNDRIGSLSLPAGPYIVSLLGRTNRGLTCNRADDLFADFLELPAGNLPSPWRLTPKTGIFRRGSGSATAGFRVKPGGNVLAN